MARRKRYSRTNLIFFILVCCIVLIYFLSKDTFSLFQSEIKGSSDTDIAFYIFDDSLQTHQLFLGDLSPGDSKTITFDVKNSQDSRVAEVDLSYVLTIKCTENLPLDIQLYEDNRRVNNYRFEKDEYGTWFYYITTDEHELIHSVQETHSYRLALNFPADKDDPKYQDIVEAIEITVDSKQIIE